MKCTVLIVCVLFCMAVVPNNVDGLKCYICDDLLGKPCKSVNDGMIEECAVAKTCLKTVARGPEMEYIHRACGPIISLVDNDCKNQKIGEYDGTYCECSNDLCNGSNDIFKKPSE
ncbi:hypothetical protein PVAND_012484 [Polypedilum vanderplanki]|uniref:Protein quiver n=1 Tax=Polypedilum vanderplanki TaxID=319348 RepID=A0A9J6CMN5_POLVA|nr:hypothetical protein PVAND_012484 [Polypedilum vanderplanki]